MIWLEIDSSPSLALYRESAARALVSGDLRYPRLETVGTLREELSVPGLRAGENGNVSISLDNADGMLTRLLRAAPPIRVSARIMSESGPLFSGLITRVSLAQTARIDIEAGLFRPMTDAMPLRNSTAWGRYDNAEALPIPYGRAVTLTPVEYGDTRRHWLVADCAIGGVDAVSIDGEPTSAWSWRNGTDSTGHPVAWLELGDALPAGAKLTATLRGRLSPDDGSLVLSPDAILYDVLRHLLGMDIDSADLDDFRAQVAGIELAGVLNDTSRSIRAVIDEIMQSIGAAWSATAPGIAALWPLSASDHESVTEYSALLARDLEPTTSHDSIANVIRLNYSQDWTTGSTTQTVQLEHADSIATYGRIEREWQAKWLPSERQATALCTRLLAALASPRWTVTAAIDSTAIDLMHQVQITSSAFTTTPERIESIDLDYQRGKASATITLAG